MKQFLKMPRFKFLCGFGLLLFVAFVFATDGGIRSVLRSEAQRVLGAESVGNWSIVLYNYTCQSSGCPDIDTGCDSAFGSCKVGFDVYEYFGGTECKGAGFGGNYCHEILLWNTCALSYNCTWDEEIEQCVLWQQLFISTPVDCEYI